MMPIHMSLLMDQSKINKLLAECANRNMPVEVRRVRLTATSGPDAGVAPAAAGDASPSTTADAETPHIETQRDIRCPVEIQGIIYIYNPPDRAKLGTGAVGERLGISQAGEEPATCARPPAVRSRPVRHLRLARFGQVRRRHVRAMELPDKDE